MHHFWAAWYQSVSYWSKYWLQPSFFLIKPWWLVVLPWSCIRYELIKLNHFRGLSLSVVQLFSKQVIHLPASCWYWFEEVHQWDGLVFLYPCYNIRSLDVLDIAWIGSYERCWHNSLWFKARKHSFVYKVSYSLMILRFLIVSTCYSSSISRVFHKNYSLKPTEIKIIDFGSACMENRTVYSYIQVIESPYKCIKFLLYITLYQFFWFFCRVGTIDHLKLFLAISILVYEYFHHFNS